MMSSEKFEVAFDGVTVAVTGRASSVPALGRLIAALEVYRPLLPEEAPVVQQAAPPPNCTVILQGSGKAYPRTCARCGLGPCPYFDKQGNPRAASALTAE